MYIHRGRYHPSMLEGLLSMLWRPSPTPAVMVRLRSTNTKRISSRRIQFYRVHVGDSGAVVTPFVQVATYATRNFSMLWKGVQSSKKTNEVPNEWNKRTEYLKALKYLEEIICSGVTDKTEKTAAEKASECHRHIPKT
ncbi:uncharacterized protein DS421_13g403660 [Arachis hypogaea]|nr:uncharacterized protein DS421_13g403660 [Arachis hypogaea]